MQKAVIFTTVVFTILIVVVTAVIFLKNKKIANTTVAMLPAISVNTWEAPNENTIPAGKAGAMIRYGKELLAHTANYLGPKGSVAHISNGMNCQNCHLDAGKKIFGNNYASFISSYPKMNNRKGAPGT